tara:strand:+ start:364 stop:1188 length:825 start_codon:yes stop_codon:yes gene_type:complete
MVLYFCPRCNYSTIHRYSFKNHLNKKKICKPLLSDIDIESIKQEYNFIKTTIVDKDNRNNIDKDNRNETRKNNIIIYNKLKCVYCNKELSRTDNLNRHIKICKVKNKSLNNTEQLDKSKNTIINYTTNINNVNNVYNITLNNYGNETIPTIEPQYILKLLKGVSSAVPNLVKKIHFDPDYPENSNIKITNKKMPYASIRINNKWELTDKENFIIKLMEDKYNILEKIYEEIEPKLDNKSKKLMNEFKKKYELLDETIIQNIKKHTELMVLNHSK